MQRSIPGTYEIKDREFMYIESEEGETFHQLANPILPAGLSIAIPQSGGAIEEKVRLKLGNGISFIGISYKGDIYGWRERFIGLCEVSGRKYGFIKQGRLSLSDGSSSLIEDMEISFE
jgi:hypothetical protein